jgi:hypothetical protein
VWKQNNRIFTDKNKAGDSLESSAFVAMARDGQHGLLSFKYTYIVHRFFDIVNHLSEKFAKMQKTMRESF